MALGRKGSTMKLLGSRVGFWFGLVFGVVIGVALAILFLPQPEDIAAREGSDTDGFDLRRRAQERFGPLIERLRERYSEAFAQGQHLYERAKDDVEQQDESAESGASNSEP
jgi:hypothetical protein